MKELIEFFVKLHLADLAASIGLAVVAIPIVFIIVCIIAFFKGWKGK